MRKGASSSSGKPRVLFDSWVGGGVFLDWPGERRLNIWEKNFERVLRSFSWRIQWVLLGET